MNQFIKNTGLEFKSGQSLKTSDLNTMNDTINSLVNVVNNLMSGLFDVNIETGITDQMSLSEAIRKTTRRSIGMKVRFLSYSNKYEEFSFIGSTVDDTCWLDENMWSIGIQNIDGGTW